VDLAQHVDREVTLEGRVSRIPWQHMTVQRPGKRLEYFDLEDRTQIVVYAAAPLPAGRTLRLTGVVLKVQGGSKRPGAKVDDPAFVEYQLDVTRVQEVAGDAGAERLIEKLVDLELSFDEKRAVQDEIVGLGTAAIPALIAHLVDTRVCGSERLLLGENLLSDQRAGQAAPQPIFRDTPLQVSAVCRRLLYRIVTPDYRPSAATPFRPRSLDRNRWLFEIEDWPAWWQRHQQKSLAQIHDEIRPVIDRYYATRGEVQVVR
jgi:hypothetical protein